MKIHIVKKGDSLYELSKKYGVPLAKIVDANPQLVDPNKLDIGMKIKIPIEPVPVPEGSKPIIHKHIVKQGDSLWKLSKAWGVSLKEIIDANPQLKNPNALLVGEVVNIPSAGTYTNLDNNPHTGGTEQMPDKTIPGSKTYTGPKEEMTAPKPSLPEMPKAPEVPEVEAKPEENVELENKVYHEINIKPEITIMPELVVMPEMPKLPPVQPIYESKHEEKMVCPEMHAVPAPEPCPSYPKYPEHHMSQSYQPEFHAHQYMYPESSCGCKEHVMEQPTQDWHVPQQHMMMNGPYEAQTTWGAQTSQYPGITEQPMTLENAQLNVNQPYTMGMQNYMSYDSGEGKENMPHKSPCGCHGGYEMPTPYDNGMMMAHNCNPMYPHHDQHYMGHCHYPCIPWFGGFQQPYLWPAYGGGGMAQTMNNSAFPLEGMGSNNPWNGSMGENSKKDCGCHGRQNEDLASVNFINEGTVFNNEPVLNNQEEQDKGNRAEAKASGGQELKKVKAKSVPKKVRKQSSRPKRQNPWIKN
ncbi:LysM peptidoglycan-binding domain-containing protein [Paenibacillus sp. GCM10028914]|uniref:LysM peptidoglycan-binding domain-containing protein n=1 Tax=Paenibacillus sp. GCM10028914 TaxID=3273416 RepID=UPI0036239A3B